MNYNGVKIYQPHSMNYNGVMIYQQHSMNCNGVKYLPATQCAVPT